MKKFFAVRRDTVSIDVVLLIVRLITGYAFILHGYDKILNPLGWMQGSSIPGIFQALGAFAEFGGGIALILGVVSRLASLGLIITMIVAVYVHAIAFGHPFVSKGGGSYEPATTYFLINLFLTAMGPGRFSIDRKLFGLSSP